MREILDWAHGYHQRLNQVVQDLMQRLADIAAVTTPADPDDIVAAAQSTLEE